MGKSWFDAAKKGDIKILEKFIEKKSKRKSTTFTIDEYDEFQNTALHLTITNKHLYAAKFLIENNASSVLLDAQKNSPLHLSVWTDQIDFVELVLSSTSETVNSANDIGETPLHMAAKSGNYLIMEQLLNAGGNPNIQNQGGHTTLCVACQYGNEDIIHMLIRANPHHLRQHPNPGSALYLAASFGKLNVLKVLIKNGIKLSSRASSTGKSALHGAVSNCRVEVVRFLLNENIDTSLRDHEGKTAINNCQQVRTSETDSEIFHILQEHMRKSSPSQSSTESGVGSPCKNDPSQEKRIQSLPTKSINRSSRLQPVLETFDRDSYGDDDDVFNNDSITETEESSENEENLNFHTNRISQYKAQLKAIIDDENNTEDLESVIMKMKSSMVTN